MKFSLVFVNYLSFLSFSIIVFISFIDNFEMFYIFFSLLKSLLLSFEADLLFENWCYEFTKLKWEGLRYLYIGGIGTVCCFCWFYYLTLRTGKCESELLNYLFYVSYPLRGLNEFNSGAKGIKVVCFCWIGIINFNWYLGWRSNSSFERSWIRFWSYIDFFF